MLLKGNEALAQRGINIERQVLDTRGDLGYAIYDINQPRCSLVAGIGADPPHYSGANNALVLSSGRGGSYAPF
jgi:hypothetical protein